MDAIGIFAPLLVVLLVNLAIGSFSKPLADVVTLIIIAGPVVWSLNELRKAGRDALQPSNWGWVISHSLIVVPAALTVYWMHAGHQVWALFAILAYGMFAKGAWVTMLQSLKLGGGAEAGDDLVRRGARVVGADELDARHRSGKRDDADVTIGGVTIPRSLEAQHFLITGTTGAGKTQVINGMLRSIRTRGNRAVIADPAGGFFARFGRTGDVLFNPFDRRSVAWSPFNEIRADYDCERIARAIIPDLAGGGEGGQWQLFAQTLLAKAMLAMHRQGDKSIKKLLYWMNSADAKELEPLLAGTPAAVLTQKGNDKMLNNTRATMVPYLAVLDYLPEDGTFSVRDWVRDESEKNWLFVTYRDDQMGLLRTLVATILELAIVEGLSLSEDQQRGLWFVMDEVDSLGKITSLRAGLTKLRKYGGRLVLGLQTVSQLRTTYGRDEAQTLIANTSVKAILRAGDAETAKAMENEIGDQEIERTQVNDSFSTNEHGQSQSQSTSTQVVRQSAVLASEIMGLPDLQGYLKMPGDEIARIAVEYVSMPDANPAFAG